MNHLIAEADLSAQIICESAGTASYHVGNPPDRRMVAAASQRGMKFLGEARQFQKLDFEQFDLILAMDGENYRDIISLDPAGKYRDKVKMMCEFCTHHNDKEVPDPYYGGSDGFNYVIDLLLDACQGLLQHIISNQALKSRANG